MVGEIHPVHLFQTPLIPLGRSATVKARPAGLMPVENLQFESARAGHVGSQSAVPQTNCHGIALYKMDALVIGTIQHLQHSQTKFNGRQSLHSIQPEVLRQVGKYCHHTPRML